MEPSDANSTPESMRLRVAFIHYIACLGSLLLLITLATSFHSNLFGNLAFFGYFAAGFYLNRSVLRRTIEWHPIYNTLYNVSSAKLGFFLLWPLRYPFLFLRLGINKVL